jgi:hypothetical protein
MSHEQQHEPENIRLQEEKVAQAERDYPFTTLFRCLQTWNWGSLPAPMSLNVPLDQTGNF